MKDQPNDMDQTEHAVAQSNPVDQPLSDQIASQITIVGPSQSGKTILLSALLNDQKLMKDITDPNPNPKLNTEVFPATSASINPPKSGFESATDNLKDTYFKIFRAEDNEATADVFEHQFTLSWKDHQDIKAKRSARPFFGFGRAKRGASNGSSTSGYQDKTFAMVDGQGGYLTGRYNKVDEDEAATAENYQRRVLDAESLIICVSSFVEKDFVNEELNNFEHLLQRRYTAMTDPAEPQLKHISLCFTKAETRFLDLGSDAFSAINDPETALARMPLAPYRDLVGVLGSLADRFGVKVRAFPVSTYGFVNGMGAANFYPHPIKPGLLTRAISAESLDESDGDGKTWRDHFPAPIPDDMATALWKPFNVTSAFFYAATGRNTGPMSFSIADLQKRAAHG